MNAFTARGSMAVATVTTPCAFCAAAGAITVTGNPASRLGGAAMDVPLMLPYDPLAMVERTLMPGAETSGLMIVVSQADGPRLLKDAIG